MSVHFLFVELLSAGIWINRYDRDEDCSVEALYADERDHVWQGVAASQVVTFLFIMQSIEIVVFTML